MFTPVRKKTLERLSIYIIGNRGLERWVADILNFYETVLRVHGLRRAETLVCSYGRDRKPDVEVIQQLHHFSNLCTSSGPEPTVKRNGLSEWQFPGSDGFKFTDKIFRKCLPELPDLLRNRAAILRKRGQQSVSAHNHGRHRRNPVKHFLP